MKAGERQVSPTVDGIRRDHVARYEFAARALPKGSRVIDFACGVGYGSRLMFDAGHEVHGYDCDQEATDYARKHYGGAWFYDRDGNAPGYLPEYDAAVCFETIEHIEDPRTLLKALRESAPVLFASVPNEDVMPYHFAPGQVYAFHFRHYTKQEFTELLAECGWQVTEWHGQEGPESEVEPGVDGRTLIAVCARADLPVERERKHIAILGLGPSVRQYLELTKRYGGRKAFCDETWGINALGDVFACDRIFHMDDVRIQEIRTAAKPDSNIARMLDWLKTTTVPVVTSIPHPDYPATEPFPLAEVLTRFPYGYFNSTAAYAIAYALYKGATKITCFGMDFSYPDVHDAEKGRGCVEFWLGMAAQMGVEISLPKTTSLMDACNSQAERFYGYDCMELDITRGDEGIVVGMRPRDDLPTAEEIEHAYDHKRHPNPLIEA